MAASEQLAIDFAPDVSPQNPNTDELPDGWRVARLDQVCEINPSRKGRTNYPDDLPVTFVSMSAVDEDAGTIAAPDVRPFSEVKKGYTWFIENDVLFAKISPCMQNGKAAVARGLSNGVGFGSTEFHVLRPGPDVLPEWVHLFIRQPSFRAAAARHFTGSVGQQRVPESVVGIQVIPVPPLPEQRRIVTRIEELAAKIERARGLRREAAREIEALDASASNLLFDEDARCDWPRMSLGAVADIRSGVTLGRKLTGPIIKLPYLRVANVQDGRLDLRVIKEVEVLASEADKWRLQPGDVLLTEGGDWDKLGRGTVWNGEIPDCIHQNHIFRVRTNPADFNPRFLAALIASPYGKSYFQSVAKKTTNLASINSTQLKAFEVYKPLIAEQQRIVDYLEGLTSKANALKRLQAESAAELDALLPAVLARAFRGEL